MSSGVSADADSQEAPDSTELRHTGMVDTGGTASRTADQALEHLVRARLA